MERLLTEGASPDAEKYGDSALGIAVESGHLDVVKALVGAGAKLEATNKRGHTAPMLAAASGYERVVEQLLQHGADVAQAKEDGWTAVMFA